MCVYIHLWNDQENLDIDWLSDNIKKFVLILLDVIMMVLLFRKMSLIFFNIVVWCQGFLYIPYIEKLQQEESLPD